MLELISRSANTGSPERGGTSPYCCGGFRSFFLLYGVRGENVRIIAVARATAGQDAGGRENRRFRGSKCLRPRNAGRQVENG